jgi:hypothetical protein
MKEDNKEHKDSISNEQKAERDRILEQAYREQSQDPEFLKEIKLWDCTVGDGIEDDDN